MDKKAVAAKKNLGSPKPLLTLFAVGLVALALSLSACAVPPYYISPSVVIEKAPESPTVKESAAKESLEPQGKPRLSGRSYVVKGKRYHILATADGFQEEGLATWYGPGFHGRKTASGEIFNANKVSAAHKTLPMGTMVEVTNLDNGQKIVVRINDRGPFGTKKHIIDLSKKAARSIGVLGVSPVSIRVLPRLSQGTKSDQK